jgi:hypothetical protein
MKPFLMGEITPPPGGRHTRSSFSAGVQSRVLSIIGSIFLCAAAAELVAVRRGHEELEEDRSVHKICSLIEFGSIASRAIGARPQ